MSVRTEEPNSDDGVSLLPDNCIICNEALNIFTKGNQSPGDVKELKLLFCGLFDVLQGDGDALAKNKFTENVENIFCLKCARMMSRVKVLRDEMTDKIIDMSPPVTQPQASNWNIKSLILHKWGGEKFAFLSDEIKQGQLKVDHDDQNVKDQEPAGGGNIVKLLDETSKPKLFTVVRPRLVQQKSKKQQNQNNKNEMDSSIAQLSRLPLEVDFVNSSEDSNYSNGGGGVVGDPNHSSINENLGYYSGSDDDHGSGSGSGSNDGIIRQAQGNKDLTINYIPYEDDVKNAEEAPITSITPMMMHFLQVEQNSTLSDDNLHQRKKSQRFEIKQQQHHLKNQQVGNVIDGGNSLPKPAEAGQSFILNGVRYYSCRYCSKTFTHRSNKYRHENTIHANVIRTNVLKRMVNTSNSSPPPPSSTSNNVVVENNNNNKRNQPRNQPQLPSYNRKTPHQCKVCKSYLASNWSLQNHIQVYHAETEAPFKCTTCLKPYNTKDSLRRHEAKHNPETFYSCTFCVDGGIGFSSNRDLLSHISRAHPENLMMNLNNTPSSIEPHDIKCEVTIKEIDEDFVMPTLERMVDDVEEEEDEDQHDDNSDSAGDFNFNVPQENFFKDRESLPHKCRICGKGFGYIQNKKRHEERHKDPNSLVSKLGERHLQGGGGGYSLQSSRIVRRLKNRRLINNNRARKRVNCQYCGKSLSDIHILRNHIQAFHTGIFNFECQYCRKPYASKDSCRKHERSHENKSRYFKCPKELGCNPNIYFSKWPEFVNHFEEAHPNQTIPNFKQNVKRSSKVPAPAYNNGDDEGTVEYNDEGFERDIEMVLKRLKSQSGGLKGGPCQCFCGAQLKNNFMLERHIKAVHGSKPLECRHPTCNRRFALKSSRTNHEQSHLRENALFNSLSNNNKNVRRSVSGSAHSSTTSGGEFQKNVKVSLERLESSPNLSPRIRQQLGLDRNTPIRGSITGSPTSTSSISTTFNVLKRPSKRSSITSSRAAASAAEISTKQQKVVEHSASKAKARSLENELIRMKSGKPFRCWVCSEEKFHEGFCSYSSISIHFGRWPKHNVPLDVAKRMMMEQNLEEEAILPPEAADVEQEPADEVNGEGEGAVMESQEEDIPINDKEEEPINEEPPPQVQVDDNEVEIKKIQGSKKYNDLIFEEANCASVEEGTEEDQIKGEGEGGGDQLDENSIQSEEGGEGEGEVEDKDVGGVTTEDDDDEESMEIEDVNMEEFV